MAITPSLTILAKDAIGHGIELAGETNTRNIDRAMRIAYYNMAIAELYTMLGFVSSESYLENVTDIPDIGEFAKHGVVSMDINYNKIITLEVHKSEYTYEAYKVPLDDFLAHKRNRGAYPPYDEAIVYTPLNRTMEFIIGEALAIASDDLEVNVYYRRLPTILTLANWDTEFMDAPDNYWSLITNRIASFILLKKGIANESLAYAKTVYDQILATVDPVIKANLIKSLDIPAGEKYDLQGYNQ